MTGQDKNIGKHNFKSSDLKENKLNNNNSKKSKMKNKNVKEDNFRDSDLKENKMKNRNAKESDVKDSESKAVKESDIKNSESKTVEEISLYDIKEETNDSKEEAERKTGIEHQIANICKYAFTAAIVVFIIFIYSYTGTSNPPFSKVEDLVSKELTEDMTDVSSRGLNRYYGLNAADYDGVMMYISNNAMSAEEILVIKVKDESQMSELEKAIQDRIKSRKKDFDGYAPAQAKLLENSKLIIRGNYLIFVASENANAYTKAFLSAV